MKEKDVRRRLMSWLLFEKKHVFAVPNFFANGSEADLFSITTSGYTHEFEIKTSRPDFLRDRKTKSDKFERYVGTPEDPKTLIERHRMWKYPPVPNYFWYALGDVQCFDHEAGDDRFGIIYVVPDPLRSGKLLLTVKRPAQLLTKHKPRKALMGRATRSLAIKLLSEYSREHEARADH